MNQVPVKDKAVQRELSDLLYRAVRRWVLWPSRQSRGALDARMGLVHKFGYSRAKIKLAVSRTESVLRADMVLGGIAALSSGQSLPCVACHHDKEAHRGHDEIGDHKWPPGLGLCEIPLCECAAYKQGAQGHD